MGTGEEYGDTKYLYYLVVNVSFVHSSIPVTGLFVGFKKLRKFTMVRNIAVEGKDSVG